MYKAWFVSEGTNWKKRRNKVSRLAHAESIVLSLMSSSGFRVWLYFVLWYDLYRFRIRDSVKKMF